MICPHCHQDNDPSKWHDEDPERIITLCCNYYSVPEALIMKKDRKSEIVKARHLTMFLIRKYTRWSLNDVGRRLRKDHTSVIHGVNRVNNALDTKTDVYEDLLKLMSMIEEKAA